jgi:hypothetical protein
MKSSLSLAGIALVATATLTACGGSDAAAYCDDLSDAKDQFESLSTSDLGSIDAAFETFHELADAAPKEVSDDWKILDDGITSIESALEEAGLTFEDLAGLQSGELPEDVDMEQLEGLSEEFADLSSESFTDASEAIEEHAIDECDVDLSTESGS